MPIPILFYFFFASLTSAELAATTIEISDNQIAVIIPVTTKDRAYTVNVFKEKDTDFAITEEEAFDQSPVDDLNKDIEKKTVEESSPTK